MIRKQSLISKIVFTNRCALCGDVIDIDSELCEKCINLPVIKMPICKSCGCSKDDCHCKKHKREYKFVAAPFYYEDTVVPAILRLKEQDMPQLADYMSIKMAETVREAYKDIIFDYVVFVPMGKIKERCRGYNQARLLAENISELLDVPLADFLYKHRYTKTLHKNKNKEKRETIVFGAFDVREDIRENVNGKTFLLVDDVKTTGATLSECAKMLKIYGASSVYCITASVTKSRRKG